MPNSDLKVQPISFEWSAWFACFIFDNWHLKMRDIPNSFKMWASAIQSNEKSIFYRTRKSDCCVHGFMHESTKCNANISSENPKKLHTNSWKKPIHFRNFCFEQTIPRWQTSSPIHGESFLIRDLIEWTVCGFGNCRDQLQFSDLNF